MDNAETRSQCQAIGLSGLFTGYAPVPPESLARRLRLALRRSLTARQVRTLKAQSGRIVDRMLERLRTNKDGVACETEAAPSGLQAGDLVRVLSREDIQATLNAWGIMDVSGQSTTIRLNRQRLNLKRFCLLPDRRRRLPGSDLREANMISFQRIHPEDVKWEDPSVYDEINVFQTLPWLNFLAATQKAEPVIAAVKSDGDLLGYFTGLKVNKHGIKVLGSPFRGWGTYFMGFSLMPDVSHREALQALPTFAFRELGCHYLEVVDPCLSASDWAGLPYKVEHLNWFAIDLTKSEGELLASMTSSGRNCIRKSIKNGVTIEEASDIGFAKEYYDQYKDVLAKRSMAPTYSLEYVQKLIEILFPTGHLLLLRARNYEGQCIATGIFLGLNKTAVFWGAASWRQHQSLRPNEPLAWLGIQKLKAKGIRELHFGGQCEQYKEKLGCYEVSLHRLMKARYSVANGLLDLVTSPKNARYRNWVLRRL